MTFKVGQETICYQHQEAQNILEALLVIADDQLTSYAAGRIKEAIVWITEANDSAVRMENKLKEYKEKSLSTEKQLVVGAKVRSLIKMEVWGWEKGNVGELVGIDFYDVPNESNYKLNINNASHWVGIEDFELLTGEENV